MLETKQIKESEKESGKEVPKSTTGYSTDVDQLARAKRIIALENRWQRSIKRREIGKAAVATMIGKGIRENYKQYSDLDQAISKALPAIHDLQAGIIRLSTIAHPNTRGTPTDLAMFVDNIFTYGSGVL